MVPAIAIAGAVTCALLFAIALYDLRQRTNPLRRIYPVVWRLIEARLARSSQSATPIPEDTVDLIRLRASGASDEKSFGSVRSVSAAGSVSVACALFPEAERPAPNVSIGGSVGWQCVTTSLLNAGALGFGPVSENTILAIGRAAESGRFLQNTGEDGLTPAHTFHQVGLVWQLGTGYAGCLDANGRFDIGRFASTAQNEQIRVIELKLSQGGKPGFGGFLPAEKNTPQVARILGVNPFRDVVSSAQHSAFRGPSELLDFVSTLSEHAGGKPVGIKLCVGASADFAHLCNVMRARQIVPDFFTIDGAEGGTGAAPTELLDFVGMPLERAVQFVDQTLTAAGLRTNTKIVASGKIGTGFDMFRAFAFGADLCYSVRALMIVLGCAQARVCHSNKCPTGIATHSSWRSRAIDPVVQAERILNFHAATLRSLMQLVASAGLTSPSEIRPWHLLTQPSASTMSATIELT